MTHLIDKNSLVAEIDRLKSEYIKHTRNKFCAEWSCGVLDNILSFIKTLEVKEVDLEREIDNWICDNAITHEDCSVTDVISTAKHFFELGLIQEQSVDEHWQDVRERAAIAAMQGTITILGSSDRSAFTKVVAEGYRGKEKTYPKEIAEFAIACADSFIEGLKK